MKPILFALTAAISAVGSGCTITIQPLPLTGEYQSRAKETYPPRFERNQPRRWQRYERFGDLNPPQRQQRDRRFGDSASADLSVRPLYPSFPPHSFQQQSVAWSQDNPRYRNRQQPRPPRQEYQPPRYERQNREVEEIQAYRSPGGRNCICWEYVAAKIPRYPVEHNNVKQLEQYAFEEAGFRRYDQPVPGAISLYQGGVLGTPNNRTGEGHVEIVVSVDASGVPTVRKTGTNTVIPI